MRVDLNESIMLSFNSKQKKHIYEIVGRIRFLLKKSEERSANGLSAIGCMREARALHWVLRRMDVLLGTDVTVLTAPENEGKGE